MSENASRSGAGVLAIYLISLIVGGGFLAVSMVAGHDHAGHPMHALHSAGDDPGALDVALGWLPVTSLRFWVFFVAFFGLTGTVLAGWQLLGAGATAAVATGVGYVSGLGVNRAIRQLAAPGGGRLLGQADLAGAEAEVLLAVAPGHPGKVRVSLGGRSTDLLAETEDQGRFAPGQRVMILSMADDGHVIVTRGDEEPARG